MSIKTICYLSFGYPTIEKSIEMAGRYIEGGCDAIEVSIPPKDPYRDSAFLQELYRVALAQTDDYSKYLEGIGRMTEQYPSTEFFFVLYHEVIMAIGAEKLGENFSTLMGAILKAKPAAAKGTYIKSCVVASTMGPGIKVNAAKLG